MKRIYKNGLLGFALSSGLILSSAPAFAGYYPAPNSAAHPQASYTAHEACKRAEDNRQVASGLVGAVVGGVIGSQVAANGARTEGSAIGAALGGLAGAGIADTTIDCDPVYPGQAGYPSQTNYPAQTTYPAQASYPPSGAITYPANAGQTSSYPAQPIQTYPDQVTYSNHPVYSDPTYGAGAVTYGTTYQANTVSYPPTPAPITSQPVYSSGNSYPIAPYSGGSYTSAAYTAAPSYQAAYAAPPPPRRRMRRRAHARAPYGAAYYPSGSYSGSHYHDRFVCTDRH